MYGSEDSQEEVDLPEQPTPFEILLNKGAEEESIDRHPVF